MDFGAPNQLLAAGSELSILLDDITDLEDEDEVNKY